MNIGDYVRTKGGNIFKIVGGNADNWKIDIDFIKLEQTEENWYESNRYNDNGYWFNEENIIKSSPNIIDLIEVGDYVNGMPVYEYDNHLVVNQLDGSYLYIEELRKIKSIVTKEQFESMEYKIESEE